MTETKEITRLFVVTDSETHYGNIGVIDGVLHCKSTPDGEWRELSKEELTFRLIQAEKDLMDWRYSTPHPQWKDEYGETDWRDTGEMGG